MHILATIRGHGLLLILLLASLCGACRVSQPPTVTIASQVAQRLTQTGLPPSATRPPASASASVTASPSQTTTPTDSPTPTDTAVPTPTSTLAVTARATVALSSLPIPPAQFGGEAHFYLSGPLAGGGYIASSYRYGSVGPGQRFAPHHGVDIGAPAGAPLAAVAAGSIYYAGNDLERTFGPQANFYGNLVVLQLAEPWAGHTVFALYGHLDQVLVQADQTVNAGDLIGTVGATGVALGAHPHLEVRVDQPDSYWSTRNPELWLAPAGGFGVVALRVTNEAGLFLPGVRVNFTCADGAERFMDTYWYSGVNRDDAYFENAAMTNIPRGYCDFRAEIGGVTRAVNGAFVEAGQVSFVWLKP